MDKILSINTIKNVFAALGAKTSDSNYGVALLDKTSGEPKGLMEMIKLASVLGVTKKTSDISNDLNNLSGNIWCRFDVNSANSPTTNDGIVFQLKLNDVGLQLAFDRVVNKIYFRINWVVWHAWKTINSSDI